MTRKTVGPSEQKILSEKGWTTGSGISLGRHSTAHGRPLSSERHLEQDGETVPTHETSMLTLAGLRPALRTSLASSLGLGVQQLQSSILSHLRCVDLHPFPSCGSSDESLSNRGLGEPQHFSSQLLRQDVVELLPLHVQPRLPLDLNAVKSTSVTSRSVSRESTRSVMSVTSSHTCSMTLAVKLSDLEGVLSLFSNTVNLRFFSYVIAATPSSAC